MKIKEFKRILYNSESWNGNTMEKWKAAQKWTDRANKKNSLIEWSFDYDLKLDYDGHVCSISSRFYPPNKAGDTYKGSISVVIIDPQEYLHDHLIEAKTLDELQVLAEGHVSHIVDKMHDAIRNVFKEEK